MKSRYQLIYKTLVFDTQIGTNNFTITVLYSLFINNGLFLLRLKQLYHAPENLKMHTDFLRKEKHEINLGRYIVSVANFYLIGLTVGLC